MSHHHAVGADRRKVQRWVIDTAARLRMTGGNRDGRLSDLSQTGARFEGSNLPITGTSGFLAWSDEEQYCRVMWSRPGSCGLQFDRPIPLEIIRRTAEMVEEREQSVANFGRIPMGRRREGRLTLVDCE
ncbi:PilZ domain-containing protein [Qipengyuania spongiae]|uniref:PilZ domain-containing protein n=1 Tax=Qipengyuania spongiae TaxID=2909673 RepID=A0ABY5T057_9SPHN|nr:PilZ domain-containing protein [Qipengyuania spongiae]UVI38748.1 PilZ domain-containing protein [Qipengyuania spongiae]